ncbi:MAG: TonB-dependent receptor [Steroidobacteraceae bacterium]
MTDVRRAVKAVLLFCSGFAFTPAATFAAAEPETVLPAVVIVATTPLPGAELDSNHIAAPTQTATADQIAASHALDLTAFMNRTLGSVYVNDVQNNPLQPDLNYRGYTASPLLGTPQGLSVYVDGVRLNQPFGDVVSWDLIPRQAIATMTLIPGSNPLFGLNTLGGALSLRTKDGHDAPALSVGLNYGSSDRRSVELETGGQSDAGLYWYGTANKLKDDGWRDYSPTDAGQAFAKLGYRNASSDLALSGAYADTDLTGNGLQDQQLLAGDYDSVYTWPDNTQNKSWLWNLVGTHRLSDTLSLSGNAYYRRISTSTLNGDINDDSLGEALYQPSAAERAALAAGGYTGYPVSGETQANTPFPSWRCIANILLNSEPNEKCNGALNRSHTRQNDKGISGQATFSHPLWGRDNQLTVGVALGRSDTFFEQSSQFGYLSPDRGVVGVSGPGAFADGSQDSENAFDARVDLDGGTRTRSLFVTDTIALTSAAYLTLSGRYDHTRLTSFDNITPADEAGTLTARHKFDRFNPGVGLTIDASPGVTAYLGFNASSRAPSIIELGCADPENPCRLPNAMAGDPPLDQVTTRNFEAGLRGRSGDRLRWNIGAFRADNRNDIMFVADDTASFGYFKNFGRTRRQGIEAGIAASIAAFTVGANYTYLDATYRSEEEVAGEGNSSNEEGAGFEGSIEIEPGARIPLVPRHIFKTFVDWRITSRITANADLQAVSSSYARGNENNEHQPDGVYYLGSGSSGGYAVVNMGLEFRPLAALSMFLQVNNVLDRRYHTAAQLGSTGFDAAGNFVARPFAGPIVDGERPLPGSTFVAPGAPRAWWAGVKYSFFAQAAD